MPEFTELITRKPVPLQEANEKIDKLNELITLTENKIKKNIAAATEKLLRFANDFLILSSTIEQTLQNRGHKAHPLSSATMELRKLLAQQGDHIAQICTRIQEVGKAAENITDSTVKKTLLDYCQAIKSFFTTLFGVAYATERSQLFARAATLTSSATAFYKHSPTTLSSTSSETVAVLTASLGCHS